ncbi:hypothetical protein O9992_29465 [Vibrio lentus]|nr:hypothetical protein [Vibrio lentus]
MSQIREAKEFTNNIDFLAGVSGGTQFALSQKELYRIGIILENDNEWQFDVMTAQKNGIPLKTELSIRRAYVNLIQE